MRINFGYISGKTLTFSVYTDAGGTRETGGTMTETPASSGLYLGDPRFIVAGDNVVIKEGTTPVGHGEYQPEVRDVIFEKGS